MLYISINRFDALYIKHADRHTDMSWQQ